MQEYDPIEIPNERESQEWIVPAEVVLLSIAWDGDARPLMIAGERWDQSLHRPFVEATPDTRRERGGTRESKLLAHPRRNWPELGFVEGAESKFL